MKPKNIRFLLLMFTIFNIFGVYSLNTNKTCPHGMFKCVDDGCVNYTEVCDQTKDCIDGSDEDECGNECPNGWFHCSNDRCILMRWRCDGHDDCNDNSDEVNCGKIAGECSMDEFRCHDNSKCIKSALICNGYADCRDKSDEIPGCVRYAPCESFECKDSHECLPNRWHCNGNVECADGSDELNCTGPANVSCALKELKFFCKDKSACLEHDLVCNEIQNCNDGSDEGGHCENRTCKIAGCSMGCFQTPLEPFCYCPKGYLLADDKRTCNDVNECENAGVCSQICINEQGSYSCACYGEYVKDKTDHRRCLASGPEPILIYSASRELKVLKLRSGFAYSIHRKLNHAVGVDYDSHDDRVYWSETAEGLEAIKSSKLDGSDVRIVVQTGIKAVEDVAVDWIGRNLYLTDPGFQRIVVCKNDGKFCAVLIENVRQPRAITLEPADGVMFWTDWSLLPMLERSSMDGSERKTIVSTNLGWPNSLTIEHITKRIYWIDAKLQRVESVKMDGSDRRIEMEDMMLRPFSLAIFEDTLYWTDWFRQTLESCQLSTGANHKVLIKETEDNDPMGIHVYHPLLQKGSNNACWNSGCTQICLLAEQGKHRCACTVGYYLHSDSKTCISNGTSRTFLAVEDTLMELFHVSIGRNSFKTLKSKSKMVIGALAPNPLSKSIIYSDISNSEVNSLDLKTGKQTTLMDKHLGSVESLAVDYISGNLYWVDGRHRSIEVARLDGQHRTVLVDQRMGHPTSLALVPMKGYMFLAMSGNRPRIEKLDMDGSDRHIFLEDEINRPSSLVVDYNNGKLYWVDTDAGHVQWATLNGKQRFVLKAYDGVPLSVAVGTDRIMWVDGPEESIFWTTLNVSSPISSLALPGHVGTKQISKAKLLIIEDNETLNGDNACKVNNGHCSHLCLPNQNGYKCFCPSGMELDADKTTCKNETKCNDREFTCGDRKCISIVMTCDGKKDCADGSDELNCKPECTEDEFVCDDSYCIPSELKCDGILHCQDGSDESNCKKSCSKTDFICRDGTCIKEKLRCDGDFDCKDMSDEIDCPKDTCPPQYSRCNNGACFPSAWFCDGEVHCLDGSDENSSCSVSLQKCRSNEFTCQNGRCVEADLRCDMDDDCGDGSDEANCSNPAECPNNMMRCPGHGCILIKSVCDGHKDCPGNFDEMDCAVTTSSEPKTCDPNKFLCEVGNICISREWLCDGYNDCGDNSDEALSDCHVTTAKTAATVLPLYEDLEKFLYHNSTFEDKSESARNYGKKTICNHDQYSCGSGECVAITALCNHKFECSDHSDEGPFCSSACAQRNGGCSQICLPTKDGPVCWCRTGFELLRDNKTCEDVNECKYLGACSHFCVNSVGTFTCTCAEGYRLRSDRRTCKAAGPAPRLLLSHSSKLLSYNLEGNHVEVIAHNLSYNIKAIDFDYEQSEVYWADSNSGTISRYSYRNKSVSTVIEGLRSSSTFAIDWINRLIVYWDRNGYIVVCTMDGENCANILHTGKRNVESIKLDPKKGHVYWCTSGESFSGGGTIGKAYENGRHRLLLASEKLIWPKGLTLDYVHKYIYWIDVELRVLETMTFDGTDRRVITRFIGQSPMTLTAFEDRLYWASWDKHAVINCEKYDCRSKAIMLENVDKVESLAVYHPVQQFKDSSVCLRPKKCSHICVGIPMGFSCLCPNGMVFVDSTNTTCVQRKPKGRQGIPDPKTISCDDDYCLNNGTCTIWDGQMACNCTSSFLGPNCEISLFHVKDENAHQDSANHGWIAGVVIAIIFILIAALAVLFYLKRFAKDKFGQFAPVQFFNPSGEAEEEEVACGVNSTGVRDEGYRNYSNPLFDGTNMDGASSLKGTRPNVKFHVSEPNVSLDIDDEDDESTETLIDANQEKNVH